MIKISNKDIIAFKEYVDIYDIRMLRRYDSDLSIHRVTAIRDVDPETGKKRTGMCLVEIDNDNTKGYAVYFKPYEHQTEGTICEVSFIILGYYNNTLLCHDRLTTALVDLNTGELVKYLI